MFKVFATMLAFIVILGIGLEVEPSHAIQQGALGFLIVRGLALVYALIAAVISYSEGKFKESFAQLKIELSTFKSSVKTASASSSGVFGFISELGNLAPFTLWISWFIIAVEIMASFYVYDWCRTGF